MELSTSRAGSLLEKAKEGFFQCFCKWCEKGKTV
jgi:hypothetical protein